MTKPITTIHVHMLGPKNGGDLFRDLLKRRAKLLRAGASS